VDLIPALTTPYPKNRRHISSSPTVNVNNVLQVLFQKLHHLYRYTVLVVLALTPTTISQPVTDASNTEISMEIAKHALVRPCQTKSTRTDVSRDRTALPTNSMMPVTIANHAHLEPPTTVTPTNVMVV
jgi:hypothetical protein